MGQFLASIALHDCEGPWYALNWRLNGPQKWSGCLGENIKFLPSSGIKPRFLQPVTVLASLFWLKTLQPYNHSKSLWEIRDSYGRNSLSQRLNLGSEAIFLIVCFILSRNMAVYLHYHLHPHASHVIILLHAVRVAHGQTAFLCKEKDQHYCCVYWNRKLSCVWDILCSDLDVCLSSERLG